MPPLNRAFAFAEINTLAVLIGEHLNLDVARTLDKALDIDIAVLESGRRFSFDAVSRALPQLTFGAHDAHAAPATAGGSFDDHGKADLARKWPARQSLIPELSGSREQSARRRPSIARRASNFLAHQLDNVRARADEFDVAGFADFGEVGRLSQKAVARMDRINVEDLGRADDRGNVEGSFGPKARARCTLTRSAKRTCNESRSTSLCTATVPMPISLHVQIIRQAISPRLPIRILRNRRGPLFITVSSER